MPLVSSSNIGSIDRDEDSGEIIVRFNTGRTYSYSGASPEFYESFLEAESKGKFFHSNIKGKLPYREITGE